MKLYPLMINLENREALIVGGGSVAARKMADLLDAGACIRIISPDFVPDIGKISSAYPDKVTVIERPYVPGDIKDAFIVFSATNDSNVNNMVFREASQKGVLINAVDDPPNCTFYIPSFFRRGDLIVALSTSGASPAMAAKLRRIFEKEIPAEIEDQLTSLRKCRELLKEHSSFNSCDSPLRGEILKKIVSNDELIEELCSCGCEDTIIQLLEQLIAEIKKS